MFTVQVRLRVKGNKELGTIGIGACIRHRQNTCAIVFQTQSAALVSEFIARPTRTCTGGITALGHKTGNYPVKRGIIVKPITSQEYKVVHRLRSLGRE